MNRVSLVFDAVAIEDTWLKRCLGGGSSSLEDRANHRQIRKYPTIFQRLPFPDHIRVRCPPFPLRAFTARHSILHLMVHPSFANRHLDISARRCPILTNTRICLTFYVNHQYGLSPAFLITDMFNEILKKIYVHICM